MNKTTLLGRLTKDPEVRYTQGEQPVAIARYTLAVDRKYKKEGEPTADFISCVAFGKLGEFAEKYLKKGIKIAVVGRIQTGSYTKEELYFETMKDVLRHLDKCGNEPIIQVEMNQCKMFGSDNYDI